jgi:hypothetical protein
LDSDATAAGPIENPIAVVANPSYLDFGHFRVIGDAKHHFSGVQAFHKLNDE